ncbi:MAG: acetyl-CoA carboxylase biotin carboxyl carrier protein [Deltaproteobacteria bacterium]|nr:acetyl-CoA carboxylase biotin carboxyl carrier protein [Deltaproteobacteria bacterium]
MDVKYIKTIYRFLRGTDIVEIEVEDQQGKLRIKRSAHGVSEVAHAPHISVSAQPISALLPKAAEDENIKVITSPMVGTFYRASSSDAQPFVEAGSVVKKGGALCIIEAMKIMNEIESECGGIVVKILVENGDPVEYGEPLFHIDTRGDSAR